MTNLVQNSFLRYQLHNRRQRIVQYAEALDWATHNRPTLNWAELLPAVNSTEGREALQRYQQMVVGLGREIYNERLWGTVGDVSWAGNELEVAEALQELELRQLAISAFTPLLCGGIAAGVAYMFQGKPRVDILSGYLEPVTREDNTSYIYGLLQIVSNADGRTYWVRLYDYEQMLQYEWPRLSDPTNLNGASPSVEPLIYPPRFVMAAADENNMPIGEFVEGLALLRADAAKQIKLERLEESHAWPLLHISEAVSEPKQIGPNTIIQTKAGGRVERVIPGDLGQMQIQHDRLLERLRRRFALRARINTQAQLSGTSIQESNQLALSAYSHYAQVLSSLLTQLAADYALLVGVPAQQVVVEVNREAYRAERINEAVMLYEKGLISLDMAVSVVTQFYNFNAEQVRAFLEARGIATGQDVQRLFGGEGEA